MIDRNKKISESIKRKWFDPVYRERVSASRRGRKVWNKGIKTGLIPKTAFKKGHKWTMELENKRVLSLYKDISELKIREDRRTTAYSFWSRQVKIRDGWKCRMENADCSGKLESHHILSYRDHPELRYDINNGITLCHFHHPRKRSEEILMIPKFQDIISITEKQNG